MGSIESHDIEHRPINDDASSGGGRPLQSNSTKDSVVSIGLALNFIDS